MANNDPNSFDTGYVGEGASIGGTVGSAVPVVGTIAGTAIGAGLGLTLGAAKYFMGSAQRKAANAIKPIDPGFQLNNEVIDNARITGEQYSNYELPGYQQLLSNIKNSGASSFVNSERGATSSADVLDAANKGNQVQQQQINQLGVETAQGKSSALTQYLAAKAASGAEYQKKNEYDQMRYDQQLNLKYQLQNNATANQFSAADQAGKLISSIFASRNGIKQPGPQGQVTSGSPIFDTTGASDPNYPNS